MSKVSLFRLYMTKFQSNSVYNICKSDQATVIATNSSNSIYLIQVVATPNTLYKDGIVHVLEFQICINIKQNSHQTKPKLFGHEFVKPNYICRCKRTAQI